MANGMRIPMTTCIGLLILLNSPILFESLGASEGGAAGLGIQMYAGVNISETMGRTYTII